MRVPILNTKPKALAQIVITLDENEKISVQATSKNAITNLGLLSMAQKMLNLAPAKDVNGGQEN